MQFFKMLKCLALLSKASCRVCRELRSVLESSATIYGLLFVKMMEPRHPRKCMKCSIPEYTAANSLSKARHLLPLLSNVVGIHLDWLQMKCQRMHIVVLYY